MFKSKNFILEKVLKYSWIQNRITSFLNSLYILCMLLLQIFLNILVHFTKQLIKIAGQQKKLCIK